MPIVACLDSLRLPFPDLGRGGDLADDPKVRPLPGRPGPAGHPRGTRPGRLRAASPCNSTGSSRPSPRVRSRPGETGSPTAPGSSATYMGYVVLLRVLAGRFAASSSRSAAAGSTRSPGSASSRPTGRMWAPWVVITVFGLVLAFTHWFLAAAPAGRDGPALRRHADAALLAPADGDGDAPDPAQPAQRHPAADDLHGRLQAGPPARADLGPDARLHDPGDGPGRWSSAASACSTSSGPSAATITRDRGRGREGQEREPDARGQPAHASRPTSSAPGWRPGCR